MLGIDLRNQQRDVRIHAMIARIRYDRCDPRRANACSISVATEASIAENSSCGASPGFESETTMSRT